jgi:hypothetical protein
MPPLHAFCEVMGKGGDWMNKEILIEKILETENLTDELEDADASWLLDWGLNRVDDVLEGIIDDEIAGGKTNDLMAVMRKMNRIAGRYAGSTPAEIADNLYKLHNLFGNLFTSSPSASIQPDMSLLEAYACQLLPLAPRSVLERMGQWPLWLHPLP